MDKSVQIRIVKNSDRSEFVIGDNSAWKFLRNGIDGFGSFTNELNFVDNGIHDGGIITNNRIGRVDRTISCAYVEISNNDNERKAVAKFFNAKATYKVYITYAGRTLWTDANIYKYALSTGAKVNSLMTLTVTFTSANPYLKSFDDFGSDIASKRGMIAFPFLSAFNIRPIGITGSVFNFAQSVSLENDGDVETFCRAEFKATGEVVNPTLIIDGQYVRVLDTMRANDLIIMDFTTLPVVITKNGENYIGHCDRTSAFTEMILRVGDNTVQYSADTGDANLSVSIYYNKLYASI